MQYSIFEEFYKIGVIPAPEIDFVPHAKPLAESLLAGGLPVAEVTVRTDAAPESIRVLAREGNGVPIGAGTVINREQAKAARDLGAQFLVFFPAEVMGGVKAIKAISDPFPQLRFIPTGGVRLENLAEYLQMKKIHTVGGS